MISRDKYAPILKGKYGEFTALSKLDDEIKQNIIPIVDLLQFVPQVVKDPKKKEKTFDDYVNTIIKYFSDKWDKERLIYIDCYMTDDEGLLENGIHPAKHLINNLIEKEFNVLPVFNNVVSLEYKQSIKELTEKIGKGTGLRIYDITVERINNEIEESLSFLNLAPNQIDLIIDLRSLIDSDTQNKIEFVTDIFDNLRYLSRWRSVVLAGGNFPIDLTDLAPNEVHALERKAWSVWNGLINTAELERIPAFSDYAISHPKMSEFESDYPNASASIRYTHKENFYVYRGRGTRQRGFEQFYDISETLINSPHFYSIEHCKGCEFIYECGNDKTSTGNLMKWRWVGTAHHITVVVNQLRQFFRDLSA
ncbi:MAG TPA: hypothetical protein ENN33_05810 [Ignavibacteria bacterium]|nr:hypothetical protein [Ignavibacteria bacterium]